MNVAQVGSSQRLFGLLLAAFVYCLEPSEAAAVTYYVSAAGNDNNVGTSTAAAWKTIAKVNTVDFSPGDKVLFRGGDIFPGSIYLDETDAGTPALPVTFDSYGTGRAEINSGTDAGMFVYNAAGISIKNLIFKSPDRVLNAEAGIYFYMDLPDGIKLSFIRIDNVDASGFNYGGIVVEANHVSMSGYTDVRITNSRAFDNVYYGILVTGYYNTTVGLTAYANSNVYIGNCLAYENPGIAGYNNHSGSGIFLSQVDGGIIEKCIAYGNGALSDYTGGGPVGIWTAAANNVVIQFNESHHNKSAPVGGADGGGFDFDGGVTNSILQYNYSHDNDGAGYLIFDYTGAPYKFGKNTVRYNVSQNDGGNPYYGGIYVSGTNDYGPVEIYNNTIFVKRNTRGNPIGFQNKGMTGVHFRNNIVVASGGALLVAGVAKSDFLMQRNNYWAVDGNFKMKWWSTTYSSYAGWQSASQQETLNGVHVGLNVDPKLVAVGGGGTINNPDLLYGLSAYQLQGSSPMINAGINLAGAANINPGLVDFFGNTIPGGGAFDLGAHEADSVVLSRINSNGDVVIGEDYESYADQDLSGNTSLAAGGSSISLMGNNWKRIPLNYLVTANTMLEFTISASDAGEVVGVGFEDNNNSTDVKRIFQVGGSQSWAGAWSISPTYTTGSGSVTYVIPAGSYYSGQMNWLVFVADDDANASTSVTFSNVRIYESGTTPSPIVVEATDPAAAKSSDSHQLVADSSASGGNWGLLSSDAVGDFVTYSLGTLTGGQTYVVSVRVKKYSNRAKMRIYAQASTDGTKYSTGDTLGYDLYSSSAGYAQLPTFTYTPGSTGTRYFRFEVIDKNSSSSGYTLSVDKITLTPQ